MAREKNILIVDDDVELGNLLAKAVRDMSPTYNVKIARNVDEAMVQVRKSQANELTFDLVITDIKMSGLSGLELLEALHSIAPGTKTIAMTAYNSPDIADRAKELNVEAYLTKPFIISEFRQIVRSNLDPEHQEPADSPAAISLSSEQKVATSRLLASLRTMTGASAALLAHSGGNVVALDALEPETNMDSLCATLETAQRAIGEQIGQTFERDCQVRQSYFGTDAYSICAYRLDDQYTVVVIFGPAVKEGQVWYYLRDAANTLRRALTGEAPPQRRRRRAAKGDVFEMLDQLLPERPQRGRRKAGVTPAKEAPPPQAEKEPEQERVEEEPEPALTQADLESLDAINWDDSPKMDWDAVIQGTDQGFAGLSLQEAQEQGLLPQDIAPATEAESPAATMDRPPVDDIDWDIDTDLDWDDIVDETDKGLGGLSFEEARKQGLIDDVEG
jgi:CheY-like chemotaxis protein